jgi:hypothetical protein
MIELLIAYFGLYLGVFLGWLSPEELFSGKQYFIFLQRIIIALLFLVSFWSMLSFWVVPLSIIAFLLPQRLWYYGILPFLYLLVPPSLFFFFLYGLPSGTLVVQNYIKKNKNTRTLVQLVKITFFKSFWFFVAYCVIFIFSWIA